MPEIISYKTVTPFMSDFIVGTDMGNENVTRNYKVSAVVDSILAALSIGTVTSISTASSRFINVTGGPFTTTGIINMALSATGLGATTAIKTTQYLRGDGTWSTPGPTPTEIEVQSSSSILTTNVDSLIYKGAGVTATSFNNNVTLEIPGSGGSVNSIIAGAGISINPTTGVGSVQISNSGVILARAGGNVTLSDGTGAITVSTIKNAGTVVSIASALGTRFDPTDVLNPIYLIDIVTTNNYISTTPTSDVINLNDTAVFHELTTSSVKTTRFRDIPASVFAQVKTFIDQEDEGKIKNVEPVGFEDVAKARQMVCLTLSDYNQIQIKNPSTLYLIAGSSPSYTTNLVRDTSGINVGSPAGTYTLTTTINGIAGVSITGPVGTNYTFVTTITSNDSTISNSNMATGFTTTGTILSGGNTETQILVATLTLITTASVKAALADINLGGNLGDVGARTVIWDYAPGPNLSPPWNQLTGEYKFPQSANTPFPFNLTYYPWNLDPPIATTVMPYTYGFNTRLLLKDTNTYKWAAGTADTTDPKYLATGYDTGNWGQNWATGTVQSTVANGLVSVIHSITGTWEYKTIYGSTLTVDTSRIILSSTGNTAPTNTYTLSTLSSSTPSVSGSATINGARYNETATWSAQQITGATNYGPGALTYQNQDGTVAVLTNTVGDPYTVKTVYAVCTLVYTASTSIQYRKLDATTYLNSVIIDNTTPGTVSPTYLLNDAEQGPFSGTSGSYPYVTPLIVAKRGYLASNNTVSIPWSPVSFNASAFKPVPPSGDGLTNLTPVLELDPTTPTLTSKAEIDYSTCTIQMENLTSAPACTKYAIARSIYQDITYNYINCAGSSTSITILAGGSSTEINSMTIPSFTGPGVVTALGGSSGVSTAQIVEYQAYFANNSSSVLTDTQNFITYGLSGAPNFLENTAFKTGNMSPNSVTATVTRISPAAGLGANVLRVGAYRTVYVKSYVDGAIISQKTLYGYQNDIVSETISFGLIDHGSVLKITVSEDYSNP